MCKGSKNGLRGTPAVHLSSPIAVGGGVNIGANEGVFATGTLND